TSNARQAASRRRGTVKGQRSDAPIGVFDSGVGGLTVFREIARAVPHHPLIYLGDSARVPYGTKSPETIVRYSLQAAEHLLGRSHRLARTPPRRCATSSHLPRTLRARAAREGGARNDRALFAARRRASGGAASRCSSSRATPPRLRRCRRCRSGCPFP